MRYLSVLLLAALLSACASSCAPGDQQCFAAEQRRAEAAMIFLTGVTNNANQRAAIYQQQGNTINQTQQPRTITCQTEPVTQVTRCK
ncbi:hypothetical protein PV762_02325 [Mitsuaria sp. CC2]|uniref:hypothetical protein n=1 Tax=Mitsuaria sp. CC2 TaxID=3029186 RepID=UPI003B8C1347